MAAITLKRRKPSGSASASTQHVDRFLRRDTSQGRREVASHPDVLVGIAQEVRERVDDWFPVADENLARRRLVPAIAQQRDEGRHEQHVEGLDRLEAAERLSGNRRVGISR